MKTKRSSGHARAVASGSYVPKRTPKEAAQDGGTFRFESATLPELERKLAAIKP